MPIAPPDENLLDLQPMELMDLFGRMRSLTDKAGFTGTLPAIWQCSDESQSIKKSLFGYTYNCPSFNLGRVGALLDPTRLATAAHHGNDLVIFGGSHIGAAEQDGRLTRKKRNKILAEMTDDVAAFVLRNNYLQVACAGLPELALVHRF